MIIFLISDHKINLFRMLLDKHDGLIFGQIGQNQSIQRVVADFDIHAHYAAEDCENSFIKPGMIILNIRSG